MTSLIVDGMSLLRSARDYSAYSARATAAAGSRRALSSGRRIGDNLGVNRQVAAAASCAALCLFVAAFVVQRPAPVALPVERASNVFFVRATVNGQGPFSFTVDTGATLTVIDPSTARRAGLAVHAAGRRHVGVGADETDLLTTTGATIEIAGLPAFSPPRLYVVPVQANAHPLGHAVDGVLGTDVLRGYVVEFDYAASRVTLSAPRGGRRGAAGDDGVAITLHGNVLVAPATIALPDGAEVPSRLLLDTGSNGSLTLTTPFVRRHGLADRFPARRASAAIGINGMSISPVIQLQSIAFGAALIRGPDAALSKTGAGLHASTDFDGILGAELLRGFRVVIDYPGQRLRLVRQ
jgi:predicted aspartyl protease